MRAGGYVVPDLGRLGQATNSGLALDQTEIATIKLEF
jgi:hypothetical protein